MTKLELLKSIVNSPHMLYSSHNDIPDEELQLINELECEEYLYRHSSFSLKPTKDGLRASKFNSFDEYELSKKQNSGSATITNNVTAGISKIENSVNSNKNEIEKKDFLIN